MKLLLHACKVLLVDLVIQMSQVILICLVVKVRDCKGVAGLISSLICVYCLWISSELLQLFSFLGGDGVLKSLIVLDPSLSLIWHLFGDEELLN